MVKVITGSIALLLVGCMASNEANIRSSVATKADSVVLCYAIIDPALDIDPATAIAELKTRGVDSCLPLIADHQCPAEMDSRQECIDKTKTEIMAKAGSTDGSSQLGTGLMLKGAGIAVGILPF